MNITGLSGRGKIVKYYTDWDFGLWPAVDRIQRGDRRGNPGSLCVSRNITWVVVENIRGEV